MDGNSFRVIGIDVGKRMLDVFRERSSRKERFANDAMGISTFVRSLDSTQDVVVFERCGGYERALEMALAEANVRWSTVHPLRVKAFRTASGIKAKTDAIDAKLLMAFGRHQLLKGELRFGSYADVRLDALMARWRQLGRALHAERCRLDTIVEASVRASIERSIAFLKQELRLIEAELEAHEAANGLLAFKEKVLCRQTGVAQLTARALLSALPELGRLDRKQVTSLGGLAPRIRESGTKKRRRGLEDGRVSVKATLFNPTRVATRWDKEMKAFAAQLTARGKPGKVVMVAVMRKLLVRLNAILRDALAEQDLRAQRAV